MDESRKIGVYGVGFSQWWRDDVDGTEESNTVATAVAPQRVVLMCPSCKVAEMEFTGSIWPTGSPGFHHKCTGCGEVRATRREYPYIRYEAPK